MLAKNKVLGSMGTHFIHMRVKALEAITSTVFNFVLLTAPFYHVFSSFLND